MIKCEKGQKRSSMNATEDSEEHSVIWRMFMYSTLTSIRTITRNSAKMVAELTTRMSAKMVAEHYYGTALYSAVDNSCKVVAADPLSLIPLSP